MRRMVWKLMPGVCALLLAGTALAGGVVVSLDGEISGVEAGRPFEVSFTVYSAHDGSLEEDLKPVVRAAHADSGESVAVDAQPAGEPGRYTAWVTLPTPGTWTWEIEPFPGYPPELVPEFTPLDVAAPSPAPAAAAARGFAGVPLGLWMAAAILSGAAGVAVITRRLPAVRA